MGFTKYGSGEILSEPEDQQVVASRRTEEDDQELLAEMDEGTPGQD